MKRLMLMFLFVPCLILAQDQLDTTQNKIVVSEDVNECVQKIYDNPDAIKLLMTTMMSDKEKMKQMHKELMNDPNFKQMIQEMRKEMHNEMNNQDRDMQDDDMDQPSPDMNNEDDMNDQDMQNGEDIQSDTTGVR